MRSPHLIGCAALVGLTILLYLPVLLHSHWGTFDDGSLIVQSSRRLIDHPESITDQLNGGLRLGIFVWVTIVWRLFPENAAGFYATNCLLFSAAMILAYSCCYKLTAKAPTSALACGMILFAPGLFEVIYTLDKQEVYLPILFMSVVIAHIFSFDCRPKMIPVLVALTAACSAAAYVSKETSTILCVFSGAILAITALANASKERANRIVRPGLLFLATIIPFLVLHFIVFHPHPDQYISMTLHGHRLFAKLMRYVPAMPDFFVSLLFCCLVWLRLSLIKDDEKKSWRWCTFSCLLFATIVATGGLISFDSFPGLLLYIWLPIYFFLAPCLAYSLTQVVTIPGMPGRANRIVMAALVILCATQIPNRLVQAQFQFSMDALTAALGTKLSTLVQASKRPVVGAMPVLAVGQAEVPERIEFFVRDKLVRHYYDSRDERSTDFKFSMLNYLTSDCEDVHDASDPPGTFGMEFRGSHLPYSSECPKGYVGWSGFQILAESTIVQNWVKRPFTKGDWLIVPYGDLKQGSILYRGAGMFTALWHTQLMMFPQLTFKELGFVEKKITVPGGHRQTIGWRILEVTSSQPISVATTSDGWLLPGSTKIFYRFDPQKPILRMDISDALRDPIVYTASFDKTLHAVSSQEDHGKFFIDLPLKSNGSDVPSDVTPSLTIRQSPRIHVDKLRFLSVGD